VTGNSHRLEAIYLQAVGEGVETALLDGIAEALSIVFGTRSVVREGSIGLGFAFEASRGQYHSTAILQRLGTLAGGDGALRLLGITESDLFVPVLTFVFGEAQLGGPCALVSLHRLREEFYGLPARPDMLLDRAIKECVHELGHTFGLRHCFDWRCVMASTHAVERLDVKGAEFCASCRRLIARGGPIPAAGASS